MSLSRFLNDTMFYDPFREINRMRREMNSISGLSGSNSRTNSENESNEENQSSSALWRPLCDVKETDKEVIIHAELPGVNKENINIELHDGILSISGERKQEKKEENEKYHRVERSFGSFRRSMAVPEGVTEQDIKAKFDNGILEVSFAKPVEKKPEIKKISIN